MDRGIGDKAARNIHRLMDISREDEKAITRRYWERLSDGEADALEQYNDELVEALKRHGYKGRIEETGR